MATRRRRTPSNLTFSGNPSAFTYSARRLAISGNIRTSKVESWRSPAKVGSVDAYTRLYASRAQTRTIASQSTTMIRHTPSKAASSRARTNRNGVVVSGGKVSLRRRIGFIRRVALHGIRMGWKEALHPRQPKGTPGGGSFRRK